jgi:hypothetical protein
METPSNPRALVGRALLASALVMAALAVAFGTGWLPVAPGARGPVIGVLVVAAVVDAVIGLKFLQESNPR